MASISLAAFANGGLLTDPPAMIESNSVSLKSAKMKKEIWKDVVGYKGLYQVSNLGNVKGLDRKVSGKNGNTRNWVGKTIKNTLHRDGYLKCTLSNNGQKETFQIHRLKAIAHIPNPENKPQVNHRDGIKSNNGYHTDGKDNLEWCTDSENMIHAYGTGLISPPYKGKFGKHHNTSKPVFQLTVNGIYIDEFDGQSEASRATGIKSNGISAACRGVRKTAGGFKWKYKNIHHV